MPSLAALHLAASFSIVHIGVLPFFQRFLPGKPLRAFALSRALLVMRVDVHPLTVATMPFAE